MHELAILAAWLITGQTPVPQEARIVRIPDPVPTPSALVEMTERRLRGLRTAHVESAWHWHDRNRTTYFTHNLADDALLEVRRGDEEGLLFPTAAGQPYSYSNEFVLREARAGRQWNYIENALGASVRLADEPFTTAVYDFRIWGVQPLATGPSDYDIRAGHLDPRIVIGAAYRDRLVEAKQEAVGGDLVRVTLRF